MKKLISMFLLLLSISMLTGCTSTEEKANELIVGRWEYVTYHYIVGDDFIVEENSYTPLEFREDGTLLYVETGNETEWRFIEDSEYSKDFYHFSVGDQERIYLINKDYTNELIFHNPVSDYTSQNWYFKKTK